MSYIARIGQNKGLPPHGRILGCHLSGLLARLGMGLERQEGLEPSASALRKECSVRLSYWRVNVWLCWTWVLRKRWALNRPPFPLFAAYGPDSPPFTSIRRSTLAVIACIHRSRSGFDHEPLWGRRSMSVLRSR